MLRTINRRKAAILAAIVGVGVLICWMLWMRSDAYQQRAAFDQGVQLVARHPALPPAVIAEWFGAAAVYDRKGALKALQAMPAGSAREQSVSAMARSSSAFSASTERSDSST